MARQILKADFGLRECSPDIMRRILFSTFLIVTALVAGALAQAAEDTYAITESTNAVTLNGDTPKLVSTDLLGGEQGRDADAAAGPTDINIVWSSRPF